MNLEIENTTNYYQQRLNDINFLKSKNINPYPHFYEITILYKHSEIMILKLKKEITKKI